MRFRYSLCMAHKGRMIYNSSRLYYNSSTFWENFSGSETRKLKQSGPWPTPVKSSVSFSTKNQINHYMSRNRKETSQKHFRPWDAFWRKNVHLWIWQWNYFHHRRLILTRPKHHKIHHSTQHAFHWNLPRWATTWFCFWYKIFKNYCNFLVKSWNCPDSRLVDISIPLKLPQFLC